MELTVELLRKHKDRLLEAITNVRGFTKHSKKGKVFNVKSHQRNYEAEIATLSQKSRAHVRSVMRMTSDDKSIRKAIALGRKIDTRNSTPAARKKMEKKKATRQQAKSNTRRPFIKLDKGSYD